MNKLDQALEICLTRMQFEGASPADCLRDFPELSDQLQPLLEAAKKMAALQDLQPSAQYKTQMRGTLFAHMSVKPRRQGTWRQPIVMRYAASLAVLTLAFVTSGTALAQRALPGDYLYNWKLESESVWRGFQTDQVDADLILSRRRLDELKAVRGLPELEELTINTYASLLNRLGLQLEAQPEKVAGAQELLSWQKEELKLFYEASDSNLPDLDEIFDVIPDVDQSTPQDQAPEGEDTNSDIAIPPVVPTLPPLKKEDDPAESGDEGNTIFEDISDLLGLP